MSELENLIARQKDLILNTCNKIGCGKCGLEWEDDKGKKCSSTELDGKILELEIREFKRG